MVAVPIKWQQLYPRKLKTIMMSFEIDDLIRAMALLSLDDKNRASGNENKLQRSPCRLKAVVHPPLETTQSITQRFSDGHPLFDQEGDVVMRNPETGMCKASSHPIVNSQPPQNQVKC
jgi:hypothetical protein